MKLWEGRYDPPSARFFYIEKDRGRMDIAIIKTLPFADATICRPSQCEQTGAHVVNKYQPVIRWADNFI